MAEDEAQQAAMRPQRAPSDAYLGGSSAKRQRVKLKNCRPGWGPNTDTRVLPHDLKSLSPPVLIVRSLTSVACGPRTQTAVTETCERLQEGASPQEVCRGMAGAAARGMAGEGGGPAMTSDAAAKLVNHVVDTPGLAEVSARVDCDWGWWVGGWVGDVTIFSTILGVVGGLRAPPGLMVLAGVCGCAGP